MTHCISTFLLGVCVCVVPLNNLELIHSERRALCPTLTPEPFVSRLWTLLVFNVHSWFTADMVSYHVNTNLLVEVEVMSLWRPAFTFVSIKPANNFVRLKQEEMVLSWFGNKLSSNYDCVALNN